jgi:hypothetical protein
LVLDLTGPPKSGSALVKLVQNAKSTLLGETKLQKLDKNIEKSGFFDKLMANFLCRSRGSYRSGRLIVDMGEIAEKNLVVVARAEGSIEFYDMGSKGDEFKRIYELGKEVIE